MFCGSDDKSGCLPPHPRDNSYLSHLSLSTWVMLALLLLVVVLLKTLYDRKYNYSLPGTLPNDPYSHLPLPPGSMGLPYFGETLWLLKQGLATFFGERLKKYGLVYKTHILGNSTVRVNGADNVRTVLSDHRVRSCWPTTIKRLLSSNSLTMSEGDRHRYLRKGVMKAFSHDALSSYVPEMQSHIRRYLNDWCKQDQVMAYDQSRRLAFALVCQVLMGITHPSAGQMDSTLALFETFLNGFFSLPIQSVHWAFSKAMNARKDLLKIIEEWIAIKETAIREAPVSSSGKVRKDLIQLIMKAMPEEDGEPPLTREDLRSLCLDLMFAGHSTVASTATSLFYFLAKNPGVVNRVLAELEEHGLRESRESDLTLDNLSKLTYVGHVVKEALRLMPPVGAVFRRAEQTFELDGYKIPKGWAVAVSIRETHLCSDLFVTNDKGEFKPERWEQPLDPNKKYHYLPFGIGPRVCPGQNFAKVLLRTLVVEACRSCCWTLANPDPVIVYVPDPRPKDRLPMTIKQRDQSAAASLSP